jgi:polar amino acid transport system substrate-binding protein
MVTIATRKGMLVMKKLLSGLAVIGALFIALYISNGIAATFIILTEDLAPFNYTQEGELTGLSTEVMYKILERVKHPKNIKVMPWSEAYQQTMQNSGCVLYSMARTKERESNFKWVGPVAQDRLVFYAKKGSTLKITSLDDARKVNKIGTYKDSVAEQFLKEEGFTNIVSVTDDKENVSKLLTGKIDLWIAGELQGIHQAKVCKSDPADLEKILAVKDTQLYIAFNKATPDEEITKWQKALDELKATGIYQKIISKYL